MVVAYQLGALDMEPYAQSFPHKREDGVKELALEFTPYPLLIKIESFPAE